MRTITTVKPTVRVVSGDRPRNASRSAVGWPSFSPEKAPAKIAIRVIPLCTVDRKRPGSAARSSAHCAPLLPERAMAFSRASRDETIANSPIASTPFSVTRARSRRTSYQGKGAIWSLMGVEVLQL